MRDEVEVGGSQETVMVTVLKKAHAIAYIVNNAHDLCKAGPPCSRRDMK